MRLRAKMKENETELELKNLKKELKNIEIGEDILRCRRGCIETEIEIIEDKIQEARAIVIQNPTEQILKAQFEDSLEEQDWGEELENIEIGTMKVEKLVLFQSKLSPKGPTYEEVFSIEL